MLFFVLILIWYFIPIIILLLIVVLLIIICIINFNGLLYFSIVQVSSFFVFFDIAKMRIEFIMFIASISCVFIIEDLRVSLCKYHMLFLCLPLILSNHYMQHSHTRDSDVDGMLLWNSYHKCNKMVAFYMRLCLLTQFLTIYIIIHGRDMFTNFLPPAKAKDFE